MPTKPAQHKPPGSSTAQRTKADRRRYDKGRGTAAERGYDADWRRVRLLQLAREPLCRFCAAFGRVTAATVVDHIQTIASAPELRLVASNHRSLCKPCHDSHTASTVGFGRTKAAKAKVKGCDADGYPLSGWQ